MKLRRSVFLALFLLGSSIGPTFADIQSSPEGASAECNDGMYSTSVGRGTCSHHGGIKRYLNDSSTQTFTPSYSPPPSIPRSSSRTSSGRSWSSAQPSAPPSYSPSSPPPGYHYEVGSPSYVPNGYYYDSSINGFRKGSGTRTSVRTQAARSFVPPGSWTGKVVRVLDGDTLMVTYRKTRVRLELYAIDAPDTKQAFGSQATAQLKRLALGKSVKIYTNGFDGQGRTLAWVFRGKDCINSMMVRDGFAWWDKPSAPYEQKLGLLEHGARSSHKGLWRNAKAISPWRWRAQFKRAA